MSFRDRSPLRNGARFRPDNRPGTGPGFGGRIGERPRIDDRPPRLDDRPPRLDDRPGRLDDRGLAPRPDWRDRERYDDHGGRGGPPEYPRGGPGGSSDYPNREGPDFGRGPPDFGRGPPDFGRSASGPSSDYRPGGPSSDYRGGGPPPADFSRGGAPPSDYSRNTGPPNDFGRSGPSGDFGRSGPVGDFGRSGPPSDFGRSGPPADYGRAAPLDQRGGGGGGFRDGGPLDAPRGGLRDAPPARMSDRDIIPPVRGSGQPPRWGDAPPKAAMPAAAGPPVPNGNRSNDCEIIVTHKALTEYAEFIERRLKKLGLSVDLLFPNEEVPLNRVLANIASRGTLYAVVVTQLSEEHRSVTINILYGNATQEHRNIPLEDGLQLLIRNFEAYTHGEKMSVVAAPGGIPVNPSGVPLGQKHPEIIHTLLSLLLENKPLTVLQYEKLINYLQDQRETQMKFEVGDSIRSDGDNQRTQNQLQNRILDILKSTDGAKDKMGGGMRHDPPPLLKDPSIQKAIENLVQNNLLKPPGGPMSGGPPPRGYGSTSYGGRK